MKKAIAVLVAAGLLLGVGFGCGGDSGSAMDADVKPAMDIQDDAEKYDPYQIECPVCGQKPIKADLYSEADGRRIYFDREECVSKFEENPQQYLDEYQKRRMEQQGQGSHVKPGAGKK